MNHLLGKAVSFIPCFYYKKNVLDKNEECRPIRGVIEFVYPEHGWFSVSYPACDGSVQRECFKEADIGRLVTLVGRSKVDKTRNRSAR